MGLLDTIYAEAKKERGPLGLRVGDFVPYVSGLLAADDARLAAQQGNYGEAAGALAGLVPGGRLVKKLTGVDLGSVSPRQIDTYHSSPYKFDRFDSKKVKTGEGATAYGEGTYLAENPKVGGMGGEYFNQFKTHPETPKTGGPYAYRVDLPDEKVAQMLDWNEPLDRQPEVVRSALADIASRIASAEEARRLELNRLSPGRLTHPVLGKIASREVTPGQLPGSRLYEKLGLDLGGQDKASRYLAEKGVPGLKYLDGFSRSGKSETRNFVVFPGEAEQLKILERNGLLLD